MKRALNIEFRDIRYFDTIATLGNLGRAAKVLCRTQPALSKCIQRLEEQIGTALFERKGRGLELTATGRAFHARATKILATADYYLNDLQTFTAGSIGKVRVGCGPITADYLLPLICSLALRYEPKMQLEVTINTNYVLKQMIRQNRLDMIVGVVSDDREFLHRAFIKDTVVVAASQGHPIFGQEAVSMSALLNYGWILPAPLVRSRKWLDTTFSEHGLDLPTAHIETNTLPTLIELIGSTDLLCFLSRLTLSHPKTRGILREVKVPETTMTRWLGITYPREPLPPAATRLIELLDEHTADAAP